MIRGKIVIEELKDGLIAKTKDFMLNIIRNDFGYEFNPEWHWDIASLKDTYIKNVKSKIFVATSGGTVLGTIAGRPYDRIISELSNKQYSSKYTLGLWRHYVRSDFRGKGIGTILLKEIEKFAKESGYTTIYLHTQKTFPGSLEYWLAKGYKKTLDSNDELLTVHLEKKI